MAHVTCEFECLYCGESWAVWIDQSAIEGFKQTCKKCGDTKIKAKTWYIAKVDAYADPAKYQGQKIDAYAGSPPFPLARPEHIKRLLKMGPKKETPTPIDMGRTILWKAGKLGPSIDPYQIPDFHHEHCSTWPDLERAKKHCDEMSAPLRSCHFFGEPKSGVSADPGDSLARAMLNQIQLAESQEANPYLDELRHIYRNTKFVRGLSKDAS